jgi:peroxiredoxin Q/BCP
MSKTPQEGERIPDFELETDTHGTIRPADFRGKKLVLYIYPKDNTKGCTQEAEDFSRLKEAFEAADTVVIGVSPDTVRKHANFRKKHDLSIILAADPERTIIEGWGLWVEKMFYGRKYMGAERTTFLVDRGGKIARVWRNVKKLDGHAEEVLEAAKALP